MGVHVFPILNPLPPPSPSHPSGSYQCTIPEHPVSYIEPGLARSGLFKGAEEIWENWGIKSSNISLQVWIGGSEKLGMRVAELRVGQSSKENSGDSWRVTWISWIQEGDKRALALCESKSLRSCDEWMTVGVPKVSFLLSWARSVAAARTRRQPGHPCMVVSSCFDREALVAKKGPCICSKTPRAILCLSVYGV